MPDTAVLLMAFGGPERIADVGPFMTKLVGRPPAPPVLARVVERYQAIGGGSPLPRIVREQAAALAQQLASEGTAVPVHAAFQYAEPSIEQVVCSLAKAGCRRIVGLSASPHHARVTTGSYFAALRSAAEASAVQVITADDYYAHPSFLDALAAEARFALATPQHPHRAHLVFTAHSLPLEHIAAGDPYVEQLRATVAGVLVRLPGHDWSLAYQSKGMGQGDWLDPTAETVLEGLARDGVTNVILLPVGFTADHVETLYDIDVLIASKARSLGLAFQRAAAPNSAPLFIAALAAAVRNHL